MSKYSKLPDNIIKIKLEKLITEEGLDNELKGKIKSSLDPFDRKEAETLCIEAETKVNEFKKSIKKVEETLKISSNVIQICKDEDDEIKEEKKTFILSIPKTEWTALKNSMGIPIVDENDQPIFNNLKEQFLDSINKSPVKLYKARYYDRSIFSENWQFKFINLNSGFAREFEELNDNCFTCFRLSIDPETKECIYESWWIVNSIETLEFILGDDYKYFIWTDFSEERQIFTTEFMKQENPKYLSEVYLH